MFADELFERLEKEYSPDVIEDYRNSGELKKYIVDIDRMSEVGECDYHKVDSYTHSLNVMAEMEELLDDENFFPDHLKDLVNEYLEKDIDGVEMKQLLKLGAFFHDVGKFKAFGYKENGKVTFKGHSFEGALMARDFALKAGFTKKQQKILVNYVLYHMSFLSIYKSDDLSKSRLYDMFEEIGEDTVGVFILGFVDLFATRKLLFKDNSKEILKSYLFYELTSFFYRFQGRMQV